MTSTRMTQKQDDRTRIKHEAIEIASLTRSDLSYFFSVFFGELPEDKRKETVETVAGYQFEDGGKWLKIDQWMKSCFWNHYDFPPKKVAHMCCHYLRINYSMEGTMVRRAQKIKDKIRKKRTYDILKQLE